MSKTTIPSGGITDGTIATGDIADSAVTLAKTSNIGNLVKIAVVIFMQDITISV